MLKAKLAFAASEVSIKPNAGGLPGDAAVEKLLNGCAWLAMIACSAAFLAGAAQWAWGSKSNSYSHASAGRDKMMYGAGGAFGVGAAAAVINFFFNAGLGVH